MTTREYAHLSAVDQTIVIDDLVGVALLEHGAGGATVRWTNDAFAALLDLREADVTGRQLDEVVDGADLPDALNAAASGREHTVRVDTAAGACVVQLSPVVDGDIIVVVSPVRDSARAAMFDIVTGLASVPLFREHLQLGLNRRGRQGDDVALVTVTVPEFADAWQQRDEPASVLQTRVAERIEQVVRNADVLAARRPGSFVLLVVDPHDAVAAGTLVSERMLDAFATPFALDDRLQRLSLNLGIAGVTAEDEPDDALARADAALSRAIAAGPGTYRILFDDA